MSSTGGEYGSATPKGFALALGAVLLYLVLGWWWLRFVGKFVEAERWESENGAIETSEE